MALRRQRQEGTPQRLRRFVFTLNNWSQEEYDYLTQSFAPTVKWIVIGKETGANGTPHLQGACVIGKQMAFSTLKTLTGFSRAHIEPMCGAPSESLIYCTKEDPQPFLYGQLPEPGKRSDVADVVSRVLGGASIRDIARDPVSASVFVKFSRGITALRSETINHRTEPPIVIWLSGPTGTGKTRTAYEVGLELSGGPDGVWLSSGGLRWFDQYEGQPVAIFDDFRAKHVSRFDYLLRLLDRYPVSVEYKGGWFKWVAKYIFITCPYDVDTCFSKRKEHMPEDIAQLHRRINSEYSLEAEITDSQRDQLRRNILQTCISSGHQPDGVAI